MRHRRLAVLALSALVVLALAPAAQAHVRRSVSEHVQIPLAFEEGGDGTGYASFEAPRNLTLTRVRVVGNQTIDTITVFDSATSQPTTFADAVAYFIEPRTATDETEHVSQSFAAGQFIDVMVCVVPPPSLTPSGYVRLTYT